MQSPDSSTWEPASLRRRVDLDGGFTACALQRNGHQSADPEAAEEIIAEFGDFLDWPLTLQQAVSIASGEFNNIVLGDPNMSWEETGHDKCRTTEDQNYASGEAGNGQCEKCFFVSETSDSCKSSSCGVASERDSCGSSEKVGSQSSYTEDDSGTDPHNQFTPFVEFLYSLGNLDFAYERASAALSQEKKRKDSISTVFAEQQSKVFQLTNMFNNVVTAHLSDFVIDDGDLEKSARFSDALVYRREVIKSYLVNACCETKRKKRRNSSFIQLLRTESAFNSARLTLDTTSDEEGTLWETSYSVRQAVISAHKSMSIVVHQWKVMSKLYDIAMRFFRRIEISCQLILNCLKTVVKLVAPAVETRRLNENLLRELDSNGQSFPEFRNACSVTAEWALEAFQYADRVMELHRDACVALRFARRDLKAVRKYRLRGTTVVNDVTTARDRLVDLVRQSNVDLTEIWNRKLHIKTMRCVLVPHLIDMTEYCIVIGEWSVTSSDTVTTVLQTLSLATQSSCKAISGTVKAVEDSFIPASICLTGENR